MVSADRDRPGDDEPFVLVERDGPIATVTLNRARELNALSAPLIDALLAALRDLDSERDVRAIVLGGSERVFAAGADVKQMAATDPIDFAFSGYVERWDQLRAIATPLIAAVSGFCLGGGCELAMACDLIVASETAQFGLPETGVGIIPGAGGTQRLVRAIGKAKAMDVILTGRRLDAWEAERAGLVARVVAREAWLREAQALARAVAARAPIAQQLAKQAVDRAADVGLSAGLQLERQALYLAFASEDAREGLTAFVERREPTWSWK